ncbi:MAG: hypothetical protein JXK04_09795 [Campylobacterales bacterium]|nr:hypothetical protein [Campylobacterales bacterium]
MDARTDMNELLETLKQDRDELRVRMHLARMELKEEWEEAEKKWEHFKPKVDEMLRDTKGSRDEIVKSTKIIGEELKNAYRRIRERL